ncbi:MAG: hypothetical protein AAF716_02680 [Cyanobacteria bacterium P01_D01_bin.1]
MFNRFSLGATVLAIFLMAIFGISRAFNWLRDSPGTSSADRTAPAEDVRTADGADDSFIDNGRDSRTLEGDRPLVSQSNDGATSPSNNGNGQSDGTISEDVFAPTPLETAGTYIQRQKGAELDQLVADSRVEATPLSPDAAISAQGNNQIDSQTDAANSANSSTDNTPTGAASQPVPALW